jgi:hypothetical protein
MLGHLLRLSIVKNDGQSSISKALLVDWLQTTIGKLTLLTLALPFIYFLHPSYIWFLLPVLILSSFYADARWSILLIASSVFWLFTNSLDWTRLSLSSAATEFGIHLTLYKALVLLPILGFCALLIFWARRQLALYKYMIPALLIIYFICICYFIRNQVVDGYALHITAQFAYFIWPLLFAIKFQDRVKKNILHQLGTLSPFWQVVPSVLPVPNGVHYLSEVEAKTSKDFAQSQLSGLRLLVWICFLQLIFIGINQTIYNASNPILPTLSQLLSQNPLEDKSALYILASVSAAFAMVGLWATITWGFFISIARLVGFAAFRGVHSPFSSTGFNDFWARVEYYYVRLNLLLFLTPISKFCIRMGLKKAYRPLVTIIAVTLCGVFFHFIRDFPLDIGKAPSIVFGKIFKNTFYYAAIGIIVVLNIRFRKISNEPKNSSFLRFAKVCLAFIIVYFGVYYHKLNLQDILAAISRLVG